MPSFDLVSKIDPQTLDNIMNVVKKEILNRFDFRDSKTSIEHDKKTNDIEVVTENDMKLKAVVDALVVRMAKQGVDPNCLDMGKEHYASGNMIRKEIKIKTGIEKEVAKKIIKDIKDSKLKVTAQIMDDIVRVTGKKIDDLQEVIAFTRSKDYGIPLQYVNMK
jgi:uncharacterized protein YajQ (UPF0234 family)